MIPDVLKYPKNGILTPKKGLNLADNLFEVKPEEALSLRNMLYIRDSLVQRKPFRPYSTQDFATPGRFRGAHDYKAPAANARLLFYTNDGAIREYVDASSNTARVSSLATSVEGSFATVYDAVVFCNGSDTPRIGRGTTWRTLGSPAAVSTLAVGTTGAAGIAAGTYLHIVIPVIDVGGVAVVFADWSNIVRTVIGAAVTSFDLTWTDIVDSRITRYLVFRTEAGGTDFRSLGAVNAGVGAFTDNFADTSLPVTVSGGVSRPSPQYSWGTAPVASLVTFCGTRLVFGALSGFENAIKLSRKAGNAYEAEGFPANDSTLIRMPKDGNVTALIPVGSLDPSGRQNDLFIAQETACYLLSETNPDYPLSVISESLGCIARHAWVKDGSWLFFQSQRGVEFWPGSGRDLYLISDQVQPIFSGGGNQSLTANQSADDIRYEVHDNQLWITVRDSGSVTGPNKAYCLDLLKFRREFNPQNPSYSARFTGPMDNDEPDATHLGFGLLLRRIDGTLINFDNQNNRILFYDKTGSQDSIDATNTDMPVRIEQTGLFREAPSMQKMLLSAHVYAFTNSQLALTVEGEFGRVLSQATVEPNAYDFPWTDIVWTDIDWDYETWFQDIAFEFMDVVGKWFRYRFEKTDSEVNLAFFGHETYYDTFEQIRTFK